MQHFCIETELDLDCLVPPELPKNMLIVDIAAFERALFSSGSRGMMIDPRTRTPREPDTSLSRSNLLNTLGINATELGITLHNSGNDSFMTLWALQKLLEPETKDLKGRLKPKLNTAKSWSHTRRLSDEKPKLRTLASSAEPNRSTLYVNQNPAIDSRIHVPQLSNAKALSSNVPVRRIPRTRKSPNLDDVPAIQRQLQRTQIGTDTDSTVETSESSSEE